MPPTVPTQAGLKKNDLWLRQARHALFVAVALWVLPMLAIGTMVALRPTHRTVTIDSYHHAAGCWWTGQSLYIGPSGMNYLPHFALLFSPIHALPLWLGEVLWRMIAALALAGGLWQLARGLFPSAPEKPFLWATLATMPLCLESLRNGNANAQFGGVVLLAVAASLGRRWWTAAALMALATAIKPLGIALLMLAPLVYTPLRGRLGVALLCLAAFPFLFGRPEYVWSQYRDSWANLQACAVVAEHRFADINGIFRTFGTPLGPSVSKLARVIAGGLTAALWWLGALRLREREPLLVLWFYALATAYLMLFNPMTESNSYAILAPALGSWAAWFLFSPEPRGCPPLGWTFLGMALSMGLLPELLRPVFHNSFALFWHPLMAFAFPVLLARFLWHAAPEATDPLPAETRASGEQLKAQG